MNSKREVIITKKLFTVNKNKITIFFIFCGKKETLEKKRPSRKLSLARVLWRRLLTRLAE